jgi:archaellum biogenesis ATPase FlaH
LIDYLLATDKLNKLCGPQFTSSHKKMRFCFAMIGVLSLALLIIGSVIFLAMSDSTIHPILPNGWKGPLPWNILNPMSNESSSYYIQPMESQSSNDGATKCNPPGYDLPAIHHDDFFVGRENDISMVVNMTANTHIININGAPGIGKSTLAIHVGYELLRNGTSVRYINMGEKISSFKKRMNSIERFSFTVVHGSEQMEEIKSVIEINIESLQVVQHFQHSNKSFSHDKNRSFIQELQNWIGNIHCPTVLILDNCDDILQVNTSRDNFISLIYSLIDRSQFNVHVIIVSIKKLTLLEKPFRYWMVSNLSVSASVDFLDQLVTPAIDTSYLVAVAELVEGNPLALKIVGKLLNLHGEKVVYEIHEIKEKLRTSPLDYLDKATIQKEKFRPVLDVAFARLGELKQCGYVLGLFPGSFDKNAGMAATSADCFESYTQHSLLDEYYLAYNQRYQMHRLIREYVKEKVSNTSVMTFNKRFGEYYQEFLLKYITAKITLNKYDKHSLSLETHNFDFLKDLLMQTKLQSAKQLAIMAFLVSQNLLKLEELYNYFDLYMDKLSDVCQILSPTTCGRFYSYIIEYLYQNCKCEILSEYVLNIFHSSCMDTFDCRVVEQIINILCQEVEYEVHKCTQLSHREETFIQLVIQTCNCGYFGKITMFNDGRILQSPIIDMAVFLLISINIQFFVVPHFKSWFPHLVYNNYNILMFVPLVNLTLYMINHFVDNVITVLSIKFDPFNPLFVQVVNKKLCITVSIIVIWRLLIMCTYREYSKIRKEFKWSHVISCIITVGLTTFTSLYICKIQLIICHFLPICR